MTTKLLYSETRLLCIILITNILIFVYILRFNVFVINIIPYIDNIESLIKVACDKLQC